MRLPNDVTFKQSHRPTEGMERNRNKYYVLLNTLNGYYRVCTSFSLSLISWCSNYCARFVQLVDCICALFVLTGAFFLLLLWLHPSRAYKWIIKSLFIVHLKSAISQIASRCVCCLWILPISKSMNSGRKWSRAPAVYIHLEQMILQQCLLFAAFAMFKNNNINLMCVKCM